jgi:hypothetical protein
MREWSAPWPSPSARGGTWGVAGRTTRGGWKRMRWARARGEAAVGENPPAQTSWTLQPFSIPVASVLWRISDSHGIFRAGCSLVKAVVVVAMRLGPKAWMTLVELPVDWGPPYPPKLLDPRGAALGAKISTANPYADVGSPSTFRARPFCDPSSCCFTILVAEHSITSSNTQDAAQEGLHPARQFAPPA